MGSVDLGRLAAGIVAAGVVAAVAGCTSKPLDLDQGWKADQVAAWYAIPQGSRLVPQAWLAALEQPDSQALFLDKAHIEKFRFLPTAGQLPLGFVADVRDDRDMAKTHLRWWAGQGDHEPWVGMTCAACHTSDITYRGHRMRVEGGSTLADFQGFLNAFNAAVAKTRDDPAKFDRFARRVLGDRPSAGDRELLKAALATYVDDQLKAAAANKTSLHYGYGRNDAYGYIFNKVALVDNPDAPTANEPTAPVSYPFLWNVPQQSKVQWNGSAPNYPPPAGSGPDAFDQGALARNVGEVIGVFGDVAVDPGPPVRFRSSANIEALKTIERNLGTLRPPRWPAKVFGVDRALAAEGKQLYASHCASCHFELPRAELKLRTRPDGSPLEVLTPVADLGTDETAACNAVLRQADAGVAAGATTALGTIPQRSPVILMLAHMALDLSAPRPPAAQPAVATAAPKATPPVVKVVNAPPPPQPDCAVLGKRAVYKARPLAGVWATAPYLHNGSVPTLYDLMLPAAERPATFRMGSREFDPKRVGFLTTQRPGNDVVFDTRMPGDSNRGHEFGAGLSDHQRWAIVEYLKVLGE